MRYVMREKLFSLAGGFVIRDENGEDRFRVRSKVFTIGQQLYFEDMGGARVAHIRQKWFSLRPTYEIRLHGQLGAILKMKAVALLKKRLVLEIPGADDIEAEGDFLGCNYVFRRGGVTVAEVSRRSFALVGTYGVDVAVGENDLLLLAIPPVRPSPRIRAGLRIPDRSHEGCQSGDWHSQGLTPSSPPHRSLPSGPRRGGGCL